MAWANWLELVLSVVRLSALNTPRIVPMPAVSMLIRWSNVSVAGLGALKIPPSCCGKYIIPMLKAPFSMSLLSMASRVISKPHCM